MPRLISLGLASVVLMASAAASAQTASPTASAPQAAAEEKKVCKSEEVVGTRFKKKICRTPSEWAALQQDGRTTVQGYQQQACRSGAASVGGSVQC